MKRLLLSGAALSVLLAGAANAADMAVPRPAAVVYGWTGFYVGGNIGFSQARSQLTSSVVDLNPGGANPGERFTDSAPGIAAGGQIGYNWQVAPNWVLGVEADLQGSTQTVLDCILSCRSVNPSFYEEVTHSLDWLATARARVGWTNGPALFYVTGGWAAAKVKTEVLVSSPEAVGTVESRSSVSETKQGWTAGAGIEAQLVGNLTGKIEYLYVDLGSTQTSFFHPGLFPPNGVAVTASNSHIQDHVMRMGVNYKFGDPLYVAPTSGGGVYKAGPVTAPTFSWTGIYIGGNAGLSTGHDATMTDYQNTFLVIAPNSRQSQFHLSPLGGVYGAQIGVNWQALPRWVVGLEADFQATGQRDSACVTQLAACVAPVPNTATVNVTQRLPWFGTARARTGYAHGPALFYLTGGLAYGRVTTDVGLTDTQLLANGSKSFTQDKAGWTAGGGIEARLVGNLTAKLEYLYVDLGTVDNTFIAAHTPLFITSATVHTSSRVQDHVIRAGLNYLFDWNDPVVAKY